MDDYVGANELLRMPFEACFDKKEGFFSDKRWSCFRGNAWGMDASIN